MVQLSAEIQTRCHPDFSTYRILDVRILAFHCIFKPTWPQIMWHISERIISDVKVFDFENFDIQLIESFRVDETVERIVVQNYCCQVG